MEADDLKDLLKECPLLVRMNDGREILVEKPEFIVVSPYSWRRTTGGSGS